MSRAMFGFSELNYFNDCITFTSNDERADQFVSTLEVNKHFHPKKGIFCNCMDSCRPGNKTFYVVSEALSRFRTGRQNGSK